MPRLPRFRRVPDLPRLALTGRDRELLRQVRRHRFLRSTHLVALAGGSRQHVLRRLQRLYHHGYLERPRCQLDHYHQGGSRPLVYGLDAKGAALLRPEQPGPARAHRWRPGQPTRLFLEHTLLIADVLVGLELACRRHGGVRLLSGDALPLPEATRRQHEPLRWNVRLDGRVNCGVIPDAVFALESVGSRARPERVLCFLEADRGTMPVQRQTLGQSSFHRKLLAYAATWAQGVPRSRFGLPRCRVLTVTSSLARLKALLAATRELPRGQGLFLFTDVATFRSHPDPLTLPWQSVHGLASLLEGLFPHP